MPSTIARLKLNIQNSLNITDNWTNQRATRVFTDPSDSTIRISHTSAESFQTGIDWNTGVGLPVPICLSKPLWDSVITASHTLPEEQHESRVRDVLVALRLRLAAIGAASPAIAFPALLPFPPEPVPQVCPLYAVAMGDQSVPYSLTILLANEVSAVIKPTGN